MSLDVEFQLTDLEYQPLASETVRLVLGERRDWQDAGVGTRFVTDAEGRTRFSTDVCIDRSWNWINIGFTPFSWPVRVDHLAVAAELEQALPAPEGGTAATMHLLYRMDICRRPDGSCSTFDFTSVYTPDARRRFTCPVPPTGITVPDSGGLVLRGLGYQSWDHMLEPVDDERKQWHLKLALKRLPAPARR